MLKFKYPLRFAKEELGGKNRILVISLRKVDLRLRGEYLV